jgi:subtilisin family serine protease
VAVIDSGIDGDHPDFAGKIADAKSVRRRLGARRRTRATARSSPADRGRGRQRGRDRGLAPSAELLVAKVVDGNDLIDVEAEVKAIRWAVETARA